MDRNAIEKCKSRLRNAQKAVEDLRAYLEIEDLQSFEDTWFTFLFSWKSIYTTLEQGSKTTPQSRQWFGGVKQDRKDDDLLQYLFEARNDDEHGLETSIKTVPELTEIGVRGHGVSNAVLINGPGIIGGVAINCGAAIAYEGHPSQNPYKVTALDGKPILTRHTPAHVTLKPVFARGNRIYLPPQNHRGNPLEDKRPLAVATLALTYIESLVEEAAKRA